ncbi:MAG: hypothetical protein ACE5FA_00025 [Dehalococcoidia bacterium]
MVRVSIRLDRGDRFEAAMRRAPDRVRQGIVIGLHRAAELVAKQAVLNLQRDQRSLSGALASAMGGGWRVDPRTLTAFIGPAQNPRAGRRIGYGYFVEVGRRAGRIPPRGALREFARRKLRNPDKGSITQQDFLLRRAIARKGTAGKAWLEPALRMQTQAVTGAINGIIQKVLDRLEED